MIKLIDILKEIGDASSQPFPFSFYGDYGNVRMYGFETEHYPYSVELQYTDLDSYDEGTTNALGVRFYIPDDEDPDIERDDIVANKGELFRVMATITAIIKKDLKDHPEINTITFTPSKKEGETTNISRLNLYTRYIKNAFPNAAITVGDKGSIEVKFK
ncbi:hypothetical protein UFOVP331_198 [uncultured Caudovirales phage]|uniref:Uncharacterized protein n=1 Tax=uncultured Caudovirales phage TaxID=2100421 RepID=A0A6J5LVT8_9CAUD|nr:hypothetical protein UFOVP331_198 [uncultured Caudovirales phage]